MLLFVCFKKLDSAYKAIVKNTLHLQSRAQSKDMEHKINTLRVLIVVMCIWERSQGLWDINVMGNTVTQSRAKPNLMGDKYVFKSNDFKCLLIK